MSWQTVETPAGGSTPRTNLSMFAGTPLGQSWEGRFSPAPPPLMPVSSRSPSLNRTPAAPAPFQYAGTVQLPPKLPVQVGQDCDVLIAFGNSSNTKPSRSTEN